jgi:hypothetical protein
VLLLSHNVCKICNSDCQLPTPSAHWPHNALNPQLSSFTTRRIWQLLNFTRPLQCFRSAAVHCTAGTKALSAAKETKWYSQRLFVALAAAKIPRVTIQSTKKGCRDLAFSSQSIKACKLFKLEPLPWMPSGWLLRWLKRRLHLHYDLAKIPIQSVNVPAGSCLSEGGSDSQPGYL